VLTPRLARRSENRVSLPGWRGSLTQGRVQERDMDWTKVDPQLAMEMLDRIIFRLRTHGELAEDQRDYLLGALVRLRNGVPAKKAFHLTRPMGAKRRTLSERNLALYNKVIAYKKMGLSDREAFEKVSADPIAAKEGSDANLSAKAIEQIYLKIKKETQPKKTAA